MHSDIYCNFIIISTNMYLITCLHRSYKGDISSSPGTESDGENDNNYEQDGFIVCDSPVDSDSGEPDESASDSVESDMDHRKPIKRYVRMFCHIILCNVTSILYI